MDSVTQQRIALMHPKLRDEVTKLINDANNVLKVHSQVRIVQSLRTFDEQAKLYAQGRTTTGPIVTNAKPGQSLHNYGVACFSDDTEILTDQGFKRFNDLDKTEKVAAYKNGVVKYEYPKAYISNDYSGEMIHVKTRSVDLLVTPNHKMIVKKKNYGGWDEEWSEIEAKDLKYFHKIPTGVEVWKTEKIETPKTFKFTNRAKKSYQDISLLEKQEYPFSNMMEPETWWEFMGWFLSEGATAGSDTNEQKKHNGRFLVSIYQSINSDVRYKLKNCIEKTGFEYWENDLGFYIHSKELWSLLHPLGNAYNKKIERYLLEADRYLLEKLYIALIDGDGSYYNTHETYYTASKKLADSFAELCLRLGYSCTIRNRFMAAGSRIMPHGTLLKKDSNTYEIVTRRGKEQELRNGDGQSRIIKEQYSGVVYCVTTESGAVIVKRNGKISVAGNCDFCLIVKDTGISWDIHGDFNKDGVADWLQVVDVFKNAGWEWGGLWKFVDNPHLQKTFGNTWSQLLVKYNNGDTFVDANGQKYVNL
jgi:D-alanyl-D-alanine carboxypeptidase